MDQQRTLAQPSPRFAGDDGAADPLTRRAIAGARGHTGYIRALVALCTSRLLMPVVASGDETGEADGPPRAELAAVTLKDPDDGQTYLLAFTGKDSMQQWNPQARPVLCTLDELCASVGPAGASRVLIDVEGPVQFVISGDALDHFADGYAMVEFEGGDFAWVKYADQDAAAGPSRQPSTSQ